MSVSYNPAHTPNAIDWLAADEEDLVDAVKAWHKKSPAPAIHSRKPDDLHARMHVIIENQVAIGDPAAVAETVARLTEDGLKRHVVIHAVILVLMRHLQETFHSQQPFDNPAYERELRGIQAPDVLKRGLDGL